MKNERIGYSNYNEQHSRIGLKLSLCLPGNLMLLNPNINLFLFPYTVHKYTLFELKWLSICIINCIELIFKSFDSVTILDTSI